MWHIKNKYRFLGSFCSCELVVGTPPPVAVAVEMEGATIGTT